MATQGKCGTNPLKGTGRAKRDAKIKSAAEANAKSAAYAQAWHEVNAAAAALKCPATVTCGKKRFPVYGTPTFRKVGEGSERRPIGSLKGIVVYETIYWFEYEATLLATVDCGNFIKGGIRNAELLA